MRIQRQVVAELGPQIDLNTNEGKREVEALVTTLTEIRAGITVAAPTVR